MRSTFRRSIILLLLCALLLTQTGCVQLLYGGETSYTRLDRVAASQERPVFTLPTLMQSLYPDSLLIATGTLVSQGERTAVIELSEVLEGYETRRRIEAHNPSTFTLETENTYLFFLGASTLTGADYDLLVGENGFILQSGTRLYPAPGTSIELEAVRNEIDKLQRTVSVPLYYLYYQSLAALVNAADVVFVGTVGSIQYDVDIEYYVLEEGFSERYSQPSTQYQLQCDQLLKGDELDSFTVLYSARMAGDTSYDVTLEPTLYTQEDMPGLNLGEQYLFFLMRSPGGKRGAHCLFINPFQGFVPILENGSMPPILVNAVFSLQEYAPSILERITAITDGQENSGAPSYSLETWQ